MRIVLIGYRGTGKSTVGRLVAARLGLDCCDADVELERQTGQSIEQIFANEGEAGFRDREEAVLAQLVGRDEIVLALGGGAVLRAANRRRLTGAFVVWLTAEINTLAERISRDPTTAERRPNLTAQGGTAEIEQLLDARRPLYADAADDTVATDGKTPEQVAAEIVSLLHAKLRESRGANGEE